MATEFVRFWDGTHTDAIAVGTSRSGEFVVVGSDDGEADAFLSPGTARKMARELVRRADAIERKK